MRRWRAAALAPAALVIASCGISGSKDDSGDDLPKAYLEIRNVEIRTLTDSLAVLGWSTNQQSGCTVTYAPDSTFLATAATASSGLGTAHEVALAPLEQDTEYWYEILASTPFGARVKTRPQAFRTLISPDLFDTTGPVITGIEVKGITPSSATVFWRTDDRTHGSVLYGVSNSYGAEKSEPDPPQYRRGHSMLLTSLLEATTYHFRIQATNRPGLTTYSDDWTFMTAENPTLEITPDTLYVTSGEEFDFHISIRNVSNLAAISFRLAYDTGMIEIVSVRAAQFFSDNDGFMFLKEFENSAQGRLQYDASWKITFFGGVAVGTLANGGGDVATIRARVVSNDTGSSLRLVDADYNLNGEVDADGGEDEDNDGRHDTRLLDHNRDSIRFKIRNARLIQQVL